MKGKEEDDIDGESGYLIRKQECGDAGGGREGGREGLGYAVFLSLVGNH